MRAVSRAEVQRAEVDRRYRAVRDAETHTRYQMILLAADGKPAPQIGWMTRRSEDTLRRVIGRFLHRDGADVSPSTGLRVQIANVESRAQSQPAGWVGKKRLRVEALLAAAAAPVPPPQDDLVPDPQLRDELPDDLGWLLRLLPRADLYLQDEVEIALHRP